MKESLYPERTATTYYIAGKYCSLSEIIELAQDYFGDDVSFEDIDISGLHFHARCIGYDLYDPMDYDDYIVLEKVR
jgi:hypothetical protein